MTPLKGTFEGEGAAQSSSISQGISIAELEGGEIDTPESGELSVLPSDAHLTDRDELLKMLDGEEEEPTDRLALSEFVLTQVSEEEETGGMTGRIGVGGCHNTTSRQGPSFL